MVERNIVCIKWGTIYPADYVNVLYSACRRAMTGDFRFVCLTNDGDGIRAEVEVMPIPDMELTSTQWTQGGCWPKLGVFQSPLYDLTGRVLVIDLDMVVLRDLDAFFDMPGTCIGINAGPGWGRPDLGVAPELGSAVLAFDAGGLPQILDHLRADRDHILATTRTEQRFVASHVSDMQYWPEPWVASFKRHLRRPLGVDLILPPREAPKDVKIIAFHGKPNPIDLIRGTPYFWDRFPHMGHGQVDWMRRYWVDNGGKI